LRKLAEALEVEVGEFFRKAPGPSLSELLERAGTPTRWLALSEDQWQAELRGYDKTGAGERLLKIAREQMEESVAVMPYLFRGENAEGNPTLTPETIEAWHGVALRRIKTLNALQAMLNDPEVDADQKDYADLLASLYEGIGRHLENFSSQNVGIYDVVGEQPVGGP
jgi:hypothetical protein